MVLDTIIDIFQLSSLAVTLALFFIKPFRQWVMNQKEQKARDEEEESLQREVIRCLLRDAILRIYNEHCAERKLHLFDYQNLNMLHDAYKKEDGNSFVDHIWEEIQSEWEIIP